MDGDDTSNGGDGNDTLMVAKAMTSSPVATARTTFAT
ncbi:hypothetical protein Q8W33_11760 [Shimia thalassica]|nr:hypothetical protein [Shimia thalassica]MDP2519242.1 hypothetical protein [Shimia thalassica]